MIGAALEECRFNQQQAARLLGLSRPGLLNKIKRHAISARSG
jgi:transcriptional regulator of acetoin/glycerol metabolism